MAEMRRLADNPETESYGDYVETEFASHAT